VTTRDSRGKPARTDGPHGPCQHPAALVYQHDTDDRQRAIATLVSDLARPGLGQQNAPSEGTPENATGT
jgi:hypothetical protein